MTTSDSDQEREIARQALQWAQLDVKKRNDRTNIIQRARNYWKSQFYTTFQKINTPRRTYSSRNYTFITCEDGVPLLTDAPVRLKAEPRTVRVDQAKADAITECLDWSVAMTRLPLQREIAVRDMLLSGLGVLKTTWDPELDYPHGRVVVEHVDAKRIYLDSSTTSPYRLNRITEIGWRSIHEMCRLYPSKADVLRRIRGGHYGADELARYPKSNVVLGTTDREVDVDAHYFDNTEEAVFVVEQYSRDDSVLSEDEEIVEDGEKRPGIRKKGELLNPGRWLMTVVVENELCYHGPVPWWHHQHPYSLIMGYILPGELYPQGVIEHLFDIQDDENRRISRINDWLRFTVYCMTIAKGDTGTLAPLIKALEAGNYENRILAVGPQDDVERKPPPSLPSQIFEMGTQNEQFVEKTSGFREVLQGREPKAGESGKAIQAMQEFALSRARVLATHVDEGLMDCGQKLVSNIAQFWATDRTFKVTGQFPQQDETGNVVWGNYAFRTYGPQNLRPTKPVTSEGEAPVSDDDWEEELALEPLYDVTIENGAVASVSRQQDKENAMWLFDKGLYNAERLLMAMQIPQAQQIAADYEARQQAQQAAQVGGMPTG